MNLLKIGADTPSVIPMQRRRHDQGGYMAKARGLAFWGAHLAIGLLLVGCQSGGDSEAGGSFLIPGPKDAATVSPSDTIGKTLTATGFSSTDLVLVTVLTLPLPDRDTISNVVWRGVFTGSEQARWHADDRILVIARSRDTRRFRFSAPLRNWLDVSDNKESNWEQVWFNGNAKEFLQTARSDRTARDPILVSFNTKPPGIVLPQQMTTAVLRSDLVQIGLNAMRGKFATEREYGRICTPVVYVYMQLSPGLLGRDGVPSAGGVVADAPRRDNR